MADWRESDWRERPGWTRDADRDRPGARYAGEQVARRPVRRDFDDPGYEGERAAREGFGDSRHWGGYGSDRTDRGLAARAGDEVRSWFGDPDAERRRRIDEMDAWGVPGPYRGIGPRGWSRSDERIKDDVCERLWAHGAIDARDIEVAVVGAEVTLQGTVGSRREKRLAEELVDHVSGVRDVHNRLSVRRGELDHADGGNPSAVA